MKMRTQPNTGAVPIARAHRCEPPQRNSIRPPYSPPSSPGGRAYPRADAQCVKRSAVGRNHSNLSQLIHVARGSTSSAPTSAGGCLEAVANSLRDLSIVSSVKSPIRLGRSTVPPLQTGLLDLPYLLACPRRTARVLSDSARAVSRECAFISFLRLQSHQSRTGDFVDVRKSFGVLRNVERC